MSRYPAHHRALAAVFCSGVVFLLLSVFRIREYIINAIPRNLKFAISAGVGVGALILGLHDAAGRAMRGK